MTTSGSFQLWAKITSLGGIAACTLAFMLVVVGPAKAQQWSAQNPNDSKQPHYPIGTSVQVHLRNKRTITGQVEKYAGNGFWIRAEGQGPRKDRKIFFVEIKSIKPRGGSGTPGQAFQPRFGIDFSVGGADASVRVYRPNSSGDGGQP